jgi:hypothetical protein
MATYNKFNQFTKDLIDAKHNFGSATFKVALGNTAPVATNSVYADVTTLGTAGGYTAGGTATTITESTASGVAKVTGSTVTFTSTSSIGPFQYAILYNDTQTSPAKPLVAWWDYGSAITLANTETLTVTFDATNGIFQIS